MIAPISVSILKNLSQYRQVLKTFDVMPYISYKVYKQGRVTVTTVHTDHWYRYFDATEVVAYLHQLIETSVGVDLQQEILSAQSSLGTN